MRSEQIPEKAWRVSKIKESWNPGETIFSNPRVGKRTWSSGGSVGATSPCSPASELQGSSLNPPTGHRICGPKAKSQPDMSPSKLVLFENNEEVQSGTCNHDKPRACPLKQRENYFTEWKRKLGRALTSQVSFAVLPRMHRA